MQDTEYGGWNRVAPEIAELLEKESNFLPRCENDKERVQQCNVQEFTGLPSPAEFQEIISSGVPTIFRGAVFDWDMRQLWTADNFTRRYGQRKIEVGAIPYGAAYGFDMLTMDTGWLAGF